MSDVRDLIEAASGQCRTMADGSLRLTFDVPPASAADAFKLFGTPGVPSVLGRLKTDAEKEALEKREAKKEPNYFARDLVRDGYFYAMRLWLAMHDAKLWTMQQHKAYIETLPCGGHAWHHHQCNGDIVLHHADRAEDPAAGDRQPENPQKAPHYLGVPVCHTAHTWIHARATREEKRDIRTYAIKLTADQMKEAMKHYLKITSLSDITPEMLKAFENEVGL